MKNVLIAAVLLPVPALAGDPVAGEALMRNCTACHALTRPDGDVLLEGGATGPDLYGVFGRPAGGAEGYGYSAGLVALNAAGHVWDEASLAAFIANPNGFLEERLGSRHRSKMPFGLPKGASDIAAWLAQPR